MLVFDHENSVRSTFMFTKTQKIKPTEIKGNLYILQDELENLVLEHDPTIVYEKRVVLESEFLKILT